MSITKRAIFHISKVFPLSLRSYPKPSGPPFVSASNYSDWRNASEGARDSTKDRNIEMSGKAKETMREGMDVAKDQAQEMKERTKDYGREAKEKAKGYAYDTKETAKEATGAVADETKEGGYRAAEMADTVTDKAGQTVRNVGEMAKETVKGAWGMAKDTTQKIKETMVGKDDDEDKGDRAKMMDEDAVELRQKAGKSLDEI